MGRCGCVIYFVKFCSVKVICKYCVIGVLLLDFCWIGGVGKLVGFVW